MSFAKNEYQQLTLNDNTFSLTARELRMLERSWAKQFAEKIFPLINEEKFSVLYSDKASRPNTPVNVIIGGMVLQELLDLTDEEFMDSLLFDIRFQYALHTTSFKEQPISDRTFSRFRRRCLTYETETGIDLIRETVKELSQEMASLMNLNGRMKRMDSLMVASNIRKLGRMELLYTCVSDLVTFLHRTGMDELLVGMEHYYDPGDYNRVIYHSRSEEAGERICQILADADKLLTVCEGACDESPEYQLLVRVMKEQTIIDETGTRRLKTKEDGKMGPQILQNPSDPDATYREKAGKQNRGYTANVIESVGDNGSIVTDYQYEKNIHSDSQFLKEAIDSMEKSSEPVVLITDGAYSGQKNADAAAEKNIELVTTDLTGRETKDIAADFLFTEEGTRVISCPAGNAPKSCSYIKQTGQCRISFPRNKCENCPHRDQCQPKMFNRTSVLFLSKRSSDRAKSQRAMKTEQFKALARIRNGVETIPSILRRKYQIDHMPVRGLLATKLRFGIKLAALNFKKLSAYLDSLDQCALLSANS